jgi:hypothetical protein
MHAEDSSCTTAKPVIMREQLRCKKLALVATCWTVVLCVACDLSSRCTQGESSLNPSHKLVFAATFRSLVDIMIKPDGVQRGLVGQIIARFEAKGYKMIAMKVSLSRLVLSLVICLVDSSNF